MSRLAWFPLLVVVAGVSCIAIDTTTFCQKNPTSSSCTDAGGDASGDVPSVDALEPDAPDAPTADAIIGACKAGEKTCDGKTARACNAEGTATSLETCGIGCSAGSCLTVVDISAHGGTHTCVVLSNGTVRCWGPTSFSEGEDSVSKIPTEIPGIASATQVSVGGNGLQVDNLLTAVRLSNGTAAWWGTTEAESELQRAPIPIANLNDVTEVAAGVFSLCAVTLSGSVQCVGRGPFGDGTKDAYKTPRPVANLAGTTSISMAPAYFGGDVRMAAIAVHSAQARAWGSNASGQLATGGPVDVPVLRPADVYGGAKLVSMGFTHSCALLGDDTMRCAGHNELGQLGDDRNVHSGFPREVAGGVKALHLEAGGNTTCAVAQDKSVWCWGELGGYGEGSARSSSRPVRVNGLPPARKVTVGAGHVCALLESGSVMCWGRNDLSQIGDGKGGYRGQNLERNVLAPTEPAW
jgi:alpha-tubulin suppressor-like RCC1 family protein